MGHNDLRVLRFVGLSSTARVCTVVREHLDRSLLADSDRPHQALTQVELAHQALRRMDMSRAGSKIAFLDLSASVLAHRGNALRRLGNLERAQGCFERAYRLLGEGSGDLALLGRVLSLQGSLLLGVRRFDDALALLTEAEGLFRQLSDPQDKDLHWDLSRVLKQEAHVLRRIGEEPRAQEAETEAEALIRAQEGGGLRACGGGRRGATGEPAPLLPGRRTAPLPAPV